MFFTKKIDPVKELLDFKEGNISFKSAIYLINRIIETKDDVKIHIQLDFISKEMKCPTDTISIYRLDSVTYSISFEEYEINVKESNNLYAAKARLAWDDDDVFKLTIYSLISDFQELRVTFISDSNGLSRPEFLGAISN